MAEKRLSRILLATLDGHDRGILAIARALRNAGFEIIYLGLYCSAEGIINAALDEDVDMVGIASLDGEHMEVFTKVLDSFKKEKFSCIIFGGGVIPKEDARLLEKRGVKKIFPPRIPVREVVDFVKEVDDKQKKSSKKGGKNV